MLNVRKNKSETKSSLKNLVLTKLRLSVKNMVSIKKKSYYCQWMQHRHSRVECRQKELLASKKISSCFELVDITTETILNGENN